MPTAQDEQVNANLDLLLSLQLEGLNGDPVARKALQDSIFQIRDEYQIAASKASDSKYYKDLGDSVAKALPGLVKGAVAASEAFKKGDYVSGSVALLDICASVIPIFASLASASGPAGALIGALFSVVGQILSLFAPKQPSLESKIQKMLDHLQSEAEIQSITAFAHSVTSYTDTLRKRSSGAHRMSAPTRLPGTVSVATGAAVVTGTGTTFAKDCSVGQWLTFDADVSPTPYKVISIEDNTHLTLATTYSGAPVTSGTAQQRTRIADRRGIADILAMPLTSASQADDFIVAMKELQWGLVSNQTKLNTPVFENWKVAAYLQREENRAKEGWPEVLGFWCQTYVNLLTANMMLACLADPTTVDRLLVETQEESASKVLPPVARQKCHSALINLKALIGTLGEAWRSDNAVTLKIARELRPVAKERGLYAHVGYWSGGKVLYVARGTGAAAPLQWDYKKNIAWLTSISMHVPRDQRDSYTPRYTLLATVAENAGNCVDRHTLDSVTGDLSNGTRVIEGRYNGGERFHDATGIAFNEGTIGVDGSTHPQTLVALAIEDRGPACYLNYYTLDKDGKGTRVNTEPRLDGMKGVRMLYLPPDTLPDDPDADALADGSSTPPGPPLRAQNAFVVYGGVRDRNVIHVVAWNSWGTVDGPEKWASYNGIEVDPYYLWVFGKGGIACVSHASLIKCRQGKIARPTWIYHDFDKQFRAPEVKSLFPCVDGTLLVGMLDDIYTADYQINRQAGRVVTSAWTKRGGDANQVIKMPIPAWSVLKSLEANLENA